MSGSATLALDAGALAGYTGPVATPAYDRSRLKAGIAHFGVGGFHRAHQAMYLDRLMNEGDAHDWAICGIGVMDADRRMRDVLRAQDHLYTLVQKHPDGTWEPRVIGSIIDYMYAPEDPEAVIERLADPAIRIVSLTVTEGGYSLDEVTGEFDPSTPAVAHDLEPGATPTSVFGLVTAALARRRERGLPPFTVASCDNLQDNGTLARRAFASFAHLRDPELGNWVEGEVRFPCSMVDRITPSTTDSDRAELEARFGIEDRWPVVCEPFVQWALQDSFSSGRPPYERAGVQVVDDVEPYELMKLRLVNCSHQGLCYFASLRGYEFVHDAAADPLLERFLRGYMDQEATPTLPVVPGVEIEDYKLTLIGRLQNPEINDTIARLAAEGSDRLPKWLLPVVRAQLHAGRPVRYGAAIVASWARYVEGADEHGRPIEILDRRRERLVELAARQREEPLAFISNRELFGDLAEEPEFVTPYVAALRSLHEHGARATLETLVTQPG
jgi:mannitol 2-dehydrogenase